MLKLYRPTVRHVQTLISRPTRSFSGTRYTRLGCMGQKWTNAEISFRMADKPEAIALAEKCAAQGNAVRELKANKADKGEIEAAVKILLNLKAQYKGQFEVFYKWNADSEVSGVDLAQQRNEKAPKQEQEVNEAKAAANTAKKAEVKAKKR